MPWIYSAADRTTSQFRSPFLLWSQLWQQWILSGMTIVGFSEEYFNALLPLRDLSSEFWVLLIMYYNVDCRVCLESKVLAVMLWGWGVCPYEFLSRICSVSCRGWHEPPEHHCNCLHSCLFTCLWFIGPMHGVKQNALIHQDKFKSDTLLSFYYPWMWAPRGAMLIFPLSGMIIQKVFTAE